jgi:hypothetical protein
MPAPWSRKISQLHHTTPAVHTVRSPRAEPQCSTPFTYLQLHTQAIHCLLQAKFSPGEPRDLSAVEGARSGCYEVSSRSPRDSCLTPSKSRRHLFLVLSDLSQGLNPTTRHPACPRSPPWRYTIRSWRFVAQGCGSRLGKSRGYSSAQNECQGESFPLRNEPLSILFHYV